ncbi:hypothetical protein KQI41_01980 [Tissierella pigra]|uniref:hypothetical protein n=1 Tax=Tissierella pigra TaxID=2607614 RepID=UPI001C0FC75A|nr:hypothetical protein [Tissierella pigra]MBU5425167.1 hypothetical protein [Tissierella pigra]
MKQPRYFTIGTKIHTIGTIINKSLENCANIILNKINVVLNFRKIVSPAEGKI